MLSENFPADGFYERSKDGALFTEWDVLVRELRRVCPRGKVAVIPCSAIQLPKVS